MQAHRSHAVLGPIAAGTLHPKRLSQRRITLAESIDALVSMDSFGSHGVTVITEFGDQVAGRR
jgi:alcohol dehydrogenase